MPAPSRRPFRALGTRLAGHLAGTRRWRSERRAVVLVLALDPLGSVGRAEHFVEDLQRDVLETDVRLALAHRHAHPDAKTLAEVLVDRSDHRVHDSLVRGRQV